LLCRLLREPQGSPAHGLSLLCSRACAAETRPAHPRILLQDRCAWSHLLCSAPALLLHQRTRRSNFARTSGSCNFAVCSTCCDAIRAGLPPSPVLRCASNPRRVTPAPGSARVRPPRAVAHLLLPLPSAPSYRRARPRCPLCGSAPSRRAAAPPAPRATFLHIDLVAA
jgi:hypothetical protein